MNEKAKQLLEHTEFEDENGNEYSGTDFGGFGQYIANKVVKLRNQALAAQDHKASDIFKGCIIYITGYTEPSAPELKRLITLHGGIPVQYFGGKTVVTHIIATSLTARKREEFSKFKVVKPTWIIESIKREKLLKWNEFRTVAVNKTQGTISAPISHTSRSNVESDKALFDRTNGGEHNNDTPVQDREYPVNCLDPKFIETFYKNSRLHHLSTWKADLKRKYQTLAVERNKKALFNSKKRKLNNNNIIEISEKPTEISKKLILHVDFDSFFVSVGLLKQPHLKDKPVCVSNGLNGGSSDISSCNYIARKFGVRNGMWASSALKLCPKLQVLPYDFEEYEKASNALYNILMDLDADIVFPVSIDEALLDISNLVYDDPTVDYRDRESVRSKVAELSSELRNKIRKASSVEASVGVGTNVLLAKVALRKAKPEGQFFICEANALEELNNLQVCDLPGVGQYATQKLGERYITTVKQLRQATITDLEFLLGAKLGRKLHNYSFGRDNTDISIIQPQKSIGVEINWGVRVKTQSEMDIFIGNLAKELAARLKKGDLYTRHLTCKISRRATNAPIDPPKFLGCGQCDQFSKSQTLDSTNDPVPLAHIAKSLAKSLQCPPIDLRGVGLQAKVDNSPTVKNQKSEVDVPFMRKSRSSKTGVMTLTQKFKPAIDIAILDALPEEVKNEVLCSHRIIGNDRIDTEINDGKNITTAAIGITAYDSETEKIHSYRPVCLGNKSQMSDIRSALANWVKKGLKTGPHADDVEIVENFLIDIITNDKNWGKSVDIINWLYLQLPNYENYHNGPVQEWRTLFDIYNDLVKTELRKKGLNIVHIGANTADIF